MRSFKEFEKDCLKCKKCKLAKTRTQVVIGQGPVPCDLMLIGEGPGEEEDRQGIPFVGRSGQLLTKILSSVGINRPHGVYIGNIVKCRPPKNRNPESDEVEACKVWLKEQIELVNPKILVMVGAVAMKTLLGTENAISKARGTWTKYANRDTTIIFHPSYLLRYQSNEKGKPKWLTWQDMQAVKNALDFHKKSKTTEAVTHA
ncbi:uracil-DNA glycosylase [Candidatus Margulisiibacteriota bacterium]